MKCGIDCDVDDCGYFSFANSLSNDCGSHGECISNTCICQEGFTGLADLISTQGFDCQINEDIIKVLWFFNLLFYVAITLWSIPKIRVAIRKYTSINQEDGRKPSLMSSVGLRTVLVFYSTVLPANLALAGFQLFTKQRIAVDVAPTVVFIAMRVGFYYCSFIWQPYILSLLLGEHHHNKFRSATFNWLLFVGQSLPGFLLLIPLFTIRKDTMVLSFILFNFFLSMCVAASVFQARYIQHKVVSSLAMLPEQTASLRKVQARLVRQQRWVQVFGALQCLLFLCFVFVPYMYNYISYVMPITYGLMGLLMIEVLKVVGATRTSPRIDLPEDEPSEGVLDLELDRPAESPDLRLGAQSEASNGEVRHRHTTSSLSWGERHESLDARRKRGGSGSNPNVICPAPTIEEDVPHALSPSPTRSKSGYSTNSSGKSARHKRDQSYSHVPFLFSSDSVEIEHS